MGHEAPVRLRQDQQLRRGVNPGLRLLLETVDEHDEYTGGHSWRVGMLAELLASELGLNAQQTRLVADAALLHDIGKLGIPDEVLNKTEPLTDDEFELIRLHPLLGASMLARIPGTTQLASVVLAHHERWDGRGYPFGIEGDEIPLEARIIFVCDAFDAMTTERPYGRVQTIEEAMDELERCEGQQFDPRVVAAMRRLQDSGALEPLRPQRVVNLHPIV